MQADGVTPDAYAINAAINACERGGQWEEAEMLLQEMQALGLSPDRVTYNTAIAAAARAAQWEQSLRLLDAMRAGGEATAPDAWSYSAAGPGDPMPYIDAACAGDMKTCVHHACRMR